MDVITQYNITVDMEQSYSLLFASIIKELSKKAKVVVLIDEYDRLLTENYKSSNITELRNVFRNFFSVIKASYDYLRFVFLTGVTKYSNMGIFSSMNNLLDISMEKQYATMLGFTQDELETNFNCFQEWSCYH